MDHGEHIFVWSIRRTVSSNRITILRLPDNYNRCNSGYDYLAVQVYKQVWAGLVCTAADMYSITIIFSYKFKIVNNKEKPSTTGKLNQWWKQNRLRTCMILKCILLKKKKGHKQENQKDFYRNQKDVGL